MPRKKKTDLEQDKPKKESIKAPEKAKRIFSNPSNHITTIGSIELKPGETVDVTKIMNDKKHPDHVRVSYAAAIGVLVEV